jgi:hypothetical protein
VTTSILRHHHLSKDTSEFFTTGQEKLPTLIFTLGTFQKLGLVLEATRYTLTNIDST